MNRTCSRLLLALLLVALVLPLDDPCGEHGQVRAQPASAAPAQPAPAPQPAAATQPASRPEAATSAPADRLRRVHGFVSGRVQGVGFRDFTAGSANRLKLAGWVRNLADGRVEFIAEGRSDAIERLLKIVRQGPSTSRVDKLEVADEKPSPGEFKWFEVRR